MKRVGHRVDAQKAAPSGHGSGYHEPMGGKLYNLELAETPAVAVDDLLMKSGIEEARTDMRKPIVTTGSGSLQEARRVEVSVRP